MSAAVQLHCGSCEEDVHLQRKPNVHLSNCSGTDDHGNKVHLKLYAVRSL